MERTWKPTTAGILCIVSGALGLIFGIWVAIAWLIDIGWSFETALVLLLMAPPASVLGIAAVIGGYFALRRRIWGLALAGSIAALILTITLVPAWIPALAIMIPLGLASIIFIALSRREFK